MKVSKLSLAATLGAALVAAGSVMANPIAPADVTFDDYGAVEQSLTGVPGDPEMGAKIMSSKKMGNCIACHAVTALNDAPFHGEVGPVLDGVGDVRTAAELRGILTNAKMTFEGTIMPAYYKVDGFLRPGNGYTGKAADGPLDPLLSAQQIEDVVAFLSTLKE